MEWSGSLRECVGETCKQGYGKMSYLIVEVRAPILLIASRPLQAFRTNKPAGMNRPCVGASYYGEWSQLPLWIASLNWYLVDFGAFDLRLGL
jgi:hypothetical protein